jgi:hypothetical protein
MILKPGTRIEINVKDSEKDEDDWQPATVLWQHGICIQVRLDGEGELEFPIYSGVTLEWKIAPNEKVIE